MNIIVFACFLSTALACQPGSGTGDLTKKATMSFTISPPVEWTYGEGETSMGQAYSSGTASTRIKTDIKDAIRDSLPTGVSSSSIDVTPNYKPIKARLNTTCDAARQAFEVAAINVGPDSYAVSRGAVVQLCKSKTTATDKVDVAFSNQGSVQLTSTKAFYESQWKDIMDLVQRKLKLKNVVFVKGPTLN